MSTSRISVSGKKPLSPFTLGWYAKLVSCYVSCCSLSSAWKYLQVLWRIMHINWIFNGYDHRYLSGKWKKCTCTSDNNCQQSHVYSLFHTTILRTAVTQLLARRVSQICEWCTSPLDQYDMRLPGIHINDRCAFNKLDSSFPQCIKRGIR